MAGEAIDPKGEPTMLIFSNDYSLQLYSENLHLYTQVSAALTHK